ncbi:DUF5820 family protein [Halorientalis marina]|jgi:hypothetical protein|uniref:DUF5820 family protein n=1 Tax=Halorientalis marina TaxID=2931976 RepID=UPI001FF19EBF|nr:DUF5820 family protein [Halorientalis marina]
MAFDDLPAGWQVWNSEETRSILAYRPDVFDSESFPAPCLPTIYLSKGRRGRRPGQHRPAPEDPWYVTLFLEPDVNRDPETFDSREAAVAGVRDLAARFAAGELDYRALYQVPREDYLDELDELTGRGT